MSGLGRFDRQMLAIALSEIDTVRRSLPEDAVTALAQEVVHRVANNLLADRRNELALHSKDIDDLCTALLSDDPQAAAGIIERAQIKGSSYDTLCLSYLTEAARRLGQWWDDDKVSFYRVTIAAGRIYAILRILRVSRPDYLPDLRRTAVFASVPGENHTLGITIATDLARDRGWDIELFLGLPHDDLVETLAKREVSLIGLSASGRRSLPDLTKLIVALRIRNPAARILVCGQIVASAVSLVGLTGADAVAMDFDTAIEAMERLVSVQPTLM